MHPILSLEITEFDTPFGLVRLEWADRATGPKVVRIFLPGDSSAEYFGTPLTFSRELPDEENIRGLVRDIRAFLSGEPVVFGTGMLCLDLCRPFQRCVLLAEYAIPRGYVSTYGRIARYLGIPGGARAVGNALANNPFPIVIPCHRALRSDGSTGGFQGGPDMKVRLLEMEGIGFSRNGKARMDNIWY